MTGLQETLWGLHQGFMAQPQSPTRRLLSLFTQTEGLNFDDWTCEGERPQYPHEGFQPPLTRHQGFELLVRSRPCLPTPRVRADVFARQFLYHIRVTTCLPSGFFAKVLDALAPRLVTLSSSAKLRGSLPGSCLPACLEVQPVGLH